MTTMKVSPMATEPVSGAFAGLAMKFGPLAAIGVLGAVVMYLFDPPASRRARVAQAAVAGTSSLIFGKLAAKAAASYLSFATVDDLTLPMGFLVGAMSWGVFGGLAKLRTLVADKAAAKVAEKVGL